MATTASDKDLTVPQQKALLWFANQLSSRTKAPTKGTITVLFERGFLTSAVGTTGRLTEAGKNASEKLRGQREMAPEIHFK